MRARAAITVALFFVFISFVFISVPAAADSKNVYFSVTTDKTFRPGEKPKVQVYARNVDVLEFRVYRVQDPLRFFEQLDDVHQFGPQYSPHEKVEERTWLERFHDWKMAMWWRIRNFFRYQDRKSTRLNSS